jgi:hypothetical protein
LSQRLTQECDFSVLSGLKVTPYYDEDDNEAIKGVKLLFLNKITNIKSLKIINLLD